MANHNWRTEQVLLENGMEIVNTPEGCNKLMHAISLGVFGNVEHADKIQQHCKRHLQNLIESKKLSKKLESFVQDKRWVSDYYTNPELKGFERLNVEVAQSALNAKIVVYSVSQEQLCLKAVIYGNQGEQEISLYQHDQKHFHLAKFKNKPAYMFTNSQLKQEILGEIKQNEEVITAQKLIEPSLTSADNEYQEVNQILQETIQASQIPQAEESIPQKLKDKLEEKKEEIGQLRLINQLEWSNNEGQRRQSFQRRHKKSLSDTFNPFQVRVPSEFLDLFKGSNDFSSNNSQFLSLISSHHPQNNFSNNHQENFKTPLNNIPTYQNSNNSTNIQANGPPQNDKTNSLQTSEGSTSLQNQPLNSKELIYNPEENDGSFPIQNFGGQNIEPNTNHQPPLLAQSQMDFYNSNNLLHPFTNNYNPPPLNLLTPSFNDLSNLQQQQIPSLSKPLNFSLNNSQQLQNISPTSQVSQQLLLTNENLRRYMGSLKFFDENKNYGFIVMDDDNRDIFVHYDDLQKAGITKEFLKSSKQGNMIRFSFSCMQYIGKYKQSKKAVELQVMPYNPSLSALKRQQHFSYISATPSQ